MSFLATYGCLVYVVLAMKTKIVKLDAANIDLGQIIEVAELVDRGGLVAFPTETVYGIASRVKGDSLARLSNVKGREPSKPYTLHISRKEEVGRYVPTIGMRAGRLIEKAWPGPLTIVFELNGDDIERQRQRLKDEVFKGLYRDNCIGVRCVDNAVAGALLERTGNPVVAPSANHAGQSPAVDADEVAAALSGQIDLILDGGSCKYGKSSTVVRISGGEVEILRGGVYSDAEIEDFSQVHFLFVCTGNTCRSPMAEGIFRKYLAEKLNCEVDALGEMGYKVMSAGVLDMVGSPVSRESAAACAARGVDIQGHRSQPLSRKLIEESYLVFAMERMHQARVLALCPDAAGKCVLLAGKHNITDPIGQPQAVYRKCADLIESAVKKRIGELVI
ncbi:MAG: threonylcarbamoyl-AMP synthase [Sedimentisphaerales bacterium]|nr:threonylcarbamoyl-AMP synthase [Sedimentisphaerales bacterium]